MFINNNDYIKIQKINQHKKNLYMKYKIFKCFSDIDDDLKDEIATKASNWCEKYNDLDELSKLLALLLTLNQKAKLLGLNTTDEVMLFYMLAIDPELKLLSIYFEESKIDEIARRFEEEFGFKLDRSLILFEKEYNNKFKVLIDEFDNNTSLKRTID